MKTYFFTRTAEFLLNDNTYFLGYFHVLKLIFSDHTNLKYNDKINNLENLHKEMLQKFENILVDASRNVWICDPEPSNYKDGLKNIDNFLYYT